MISTFIAVNISLLHQVSRVAAASPRPAPSLQPAQLRAVAKFRGDDVSEDGRAMVRRAFDLVITHFDLANNYGPEENFGKLPRQDPHPYRDELIISSKAGYRM